MIGTTVVSFAGSLFGSFTVDASSGPGGESPSGDATGVTKYGATFGGPVTCLRVEGARATVGTRDFVFFLTADSYQEVRTSGSPDVCPPFPSGGSASSLAPPLVLRDMAP